MNKLIIFPFLLQCFIAQAQTCRDASVELTATVQSTPPQITLNWLPHTGFTNYEVYRKLKADTSWTTYLATLNGITTTYTDKAVTAGISYEYKIAKIGTVSGFGYINAGIKIPATEKRGTLILLVDSSFIVSLAPELLRLQKDLVGDGWKIIRHDINRYGSVTSVKAKIVADYNLDPANTKAVFVFGHVPVPNSGEIVPDGHANHQGAWPTDIYYADMDGSWTDSIVNNTTATDPRNHNIPGDGKFDQGPIPSPVELQIGRVDLANMPAFMQTEEQLLKNYLDKNHDYRTKVFTATHRALIDDNFGFFGGEVFAASGWKNFSPLVGTANVTSSDYFTSMTGNSYLWSYGCGSGTFTSASGVGTTADFAVSNLEGVFTATFGSYFGDWDMTNNFLRAPLAQGKTLTNCWSGRPHWLLHHMGLGENIGYDARVTQNNSFLYYTYFTTTGVHVALMGDPTLRNDIIAPVSNVISTVAGTNCNITWTASTDTVLGYYIYMKNDTINDYIRLNQNLITGTSYTDTCLIYPGIYSYMVRAYKLETTPSGSYYNLSTGIADTAYNSNNLIVIAAANFTISNNVVTFTNTSSNAMTYQWNFGDSQTSTLQNPVHTYTFVGNYTVTLIASNGCDADTITLNISMASGIEEANQDAALISVIPNPSNGNFTVKLSEINNANAVIIMYNNLGETVFVTKKTNNEISVSNLPSGIYLLRVVVKDVGILSKRVIIQ